jgi:hypothetical protein
VIETPLEGNTLTRIATTEITTQPKIRVEVVNPFWKGSHNLPVKDVDLLLMVY